jgi:folate-dependent tRNA-U54 methylase TrmFO/GidA
VNEVIHEMLRKTFAHQTGNLAKWCVPTRFDPMMSKTPWDCCTGKCALLGGIIMTTADKQTPAGGALALIVALCRSGYSHINRAPLAYRFHTKKLTDC